MYGGALALRVEDVDGAREELEREGTTFGMDTFDSGVCHGAPFTDPDGNRLQLHRRYAPAERFEIPVQEIERTDFIGMSVTDKPQAVAFYSEVLGFERNPLASDGWPEFETSNVTLGVHTPDQTGDAFKPSDYALALRVPDVAESMTRLQAAGVEFQFAEVYDSSVCHMAFFSDPDGNRLMLHHRYAPYRDGSLA